MGLGKTASTAFMSWLLEEMPPAFADRCPGVGGELGKRTDEIPSWHNGPKHMGPQRIRRSEVLE